MKATLTVPDGDEARNMVIDDYVDWQDEYDPRLFYDTHRFC